MIKPSSNTDTARSARSGSQPDDVGPGLPDLPDGQMLPAESRSKKRTIRTLAVLGLAASAVYLTWRILFTVDMSAWFVAIPMLVLEIHNAAGLGLYTFSLWDVDPPTNWHPVDITTATVALLIPTYDESPEVLLPVIAAAMAIGPAHETWVLDDGNRPAIEQLAVGLGAKYLARGDNTHAKAGNINNALDHLGEVDLVAIVDADHVVLPNFLRHTLGYFEDPKVAIVQTPQDFYNVDSFEHQERSEEKRNFNEQSVFYRVILPAKNRWGAAFWCGTGAVVRMEALRSVGGVATETITEDIHTSIRMQKLGWRTVAHNEVLARGLAAADASQYMLQRQRWARGAMQVMREERLLTSPRLTVTQRLAYSATLWGWFDSLRSLSFIAIPIVVIATGAWPIDAPLGVFAPLFLGSFAIQQASLRMLARGYHAPWMSLVFETLRMPAVIPALGELIKRSKPRFQVTPKGRTGDGRDRVSAPKLLVVMFLLSVGALVWCALTLSGLTPTTYRNPAAMIGTAAFLLFNMVLLIAATRRIIDPKYAGERRASVRFPVDMAAGVDEHPGRVRDLSLTGARVLVAETATGAFELDQTVEFVLLNQGVTLEATLMRVIDRGGGDVELGLEYVDGQWPALSDLSVVLFHGASSRGESSRVPKQAHLRKAV